MKLWNLTRLKGEELLLMSILEAAPKASIDEELDRRAVHGRDNSRRRRAPQAGTQRRRESAA